jgi:PTH1 family peptidyl-tRNA hydrolase
LTQATKLIVGLGNPGAEYEGTRHNAGFWFVDALAAAFHGSFKNERKFHGEVARVSVDGTEVFLLKPLTFMNRSGLAVGSLARFFKITPEQILVAHDELDFPPGKTRLKEGGGHGGHNGLRDIIAQLGGDRNFIRLRIGIGHPGSAREVTNFVLGKPPRAERNLIEQTLDEASRVVPALATGDYQKAVHRLHNFQTTPV